MKRALSEDLRVVVTQDVKSFDGAVFAVAVLVQEVEAGGRALHADEHVTETRIHDRLERPVLVLAREHVVASEGPPSQVIAALLDLLREALEPSIVHVPRRVDPEEVADAVTTIELVHFIHDLFYRLGPEERAIHDGAVRCLCVPVFHGNPGAEATGIHAAT